MSLVFNREFDARHGEAVGVAPGVRRVTAGNAGPLTFHGTNTFLIGDERIAVLDPGPADAAHIEALLRAVGGAKVAYILVSHSHRDHCGGARLLQDRTGAQILAAAPQGTRSRHPSNSVVDPDAGADFAPDAFLRDGDIVSGPGYRLEAIATPGHVRDHLAFALLGSDILFSGDHVMGWSTTVVAPPDGSMADYMASLDRLLGRPETRYLPAHGGLIEGAHCYVRALKRHRRNREQAIIDRLRSGDATIAEMLPHIYADLDHALAPAAALSIAAHLQDLVERDVAGHDQSLALDGRYWLTG